MSNEQDESEMMSSCDGNLPPQATPLSQTPLTPALNNTTASAASSTANTSTSSLHGGLGNGNGNTTATTSANVTQTIPSSVCCGDFIDTLNKPIKNILVTVKFLTHEKLVRKSKTTKNNNNKNKEEKNVRGEGNDDDDEANLSSSSTTSSTSSSSSSSSFGFNEMDDSLSKKLIINSNLNETDVVSYINYCNTWPQRQCFCVFTSDGQIEKFHHFLHNLIATSILVIKNISFGFNVTSSSMTTTASNDDHGGDATTANNSQDDEFSLANAWSLDSKEKLLIALMKTFSINMPLYIIYKQLLFNHGRYSRIKECSCSTLTSDSISLLQFYCQTHSPLKGANGRNQEIENLPIELFRNISHFIDMHGLTAIKECFYYSNPDILPLNFVECIFNIIVHLRLWLNVNTIEKQILPIRSIAISNYMCQLTDRDLRLAGMKNITELMYETFKTYNQQHFNSYYSFNKLNETDELDETSLRFKIDLDGLTLAYKYLMCTTLTIRLCGIAQINLQINAWSEFNALLNASVSNNSSSKIDQFCLISLANSATKNELADWLVANKIVEHLYGPNLHVEVVKRSQEIVNFLAFTNRLNEKHLECIWSSAQLKHCSKPVMDTLMSLHKHLNVDSIQYLSGLIAKLDLSQHNEQTLLLSALLTKNLWLLILDWEDEQTNNGVIKSSQSFTGERSVKKKIKRVKENKNLSQTINSNKNKRKVNTDFREQNACYSETSSNENTSRQQKGQIKS